MRAMAFAGLIICVVALVIGSALKGGLSFAILLVSGVIGLVLVGFLFSPRKIPMGMRDAGADDRSYLARLVFWGFLLRGCVSVVLHMTGLWETVAPDESTFDANGQIFALWLQGYLPYRLSIRFLESSEVGYFYLVGGLYHAMGISRFALGEVPKFAPLALNCLVGACIVYPVHGLAGYFGGRTAARRAAVLVSFFPSLVLWSTVLVRDVFALFLLASAFFCAERVRRRFHPGWLILLLASLAALSSIRTYIFLVFTVSISAGFLIGKRSITHSVFLGMLIVVLLVAAIRTTGVGESELDKMNLEHIADMRRINALGPEGTAGSLGTDVDISSPVKALSYLPLGLLYFFFSPLPWQIRSGGQVLAMVDLLFWFSVIPSVIYGVKWLMRSRLRPAVPILFFCTGTAVLYALVEGNIGILFRHRAHVIVPFCVLAGVGYAMKKRRARKEARQLERPVPDHASPRGALRPSPGL